MATPSGPARQSTAEPLNANDWQMAALEVIASGGVDAVSVEGVARQLGVTKGSFYWHFQNREALIAGALGHWESEATTRIVEELATVADPAERLRRLFNESFGGGPSSDLDVALLARVGDPVVDRVIERVTHCRLAFLEQAYRDLGLPRRRAQRQARITYAIYIGHFQLRRTAPNDPVIARYDRAYQRQLYDTIQLAPS